MTRKADPTIVKVKRKVIKLKSDLDSIAAKLSAFLGYPYSPSEWDKICLEFDEEQAAVHQVTEDRYRAACEIAVCKDKKRQLRMLSANGKISNSQSEGLYKIKEKVADAISAMSALPELGTSHKDWEMLPAEFKRQGVGHPKVTLEEMFVTVRAELGLAHKIVNDIEGDDKNSTIDEILQEEEDIAVNAGRKKLPVKVGEIEELERKKRTIIVQIDEIKAEEEVQEVKVGRGKRKLSKEDRLEKKANTIIAINELIASMETNLSATEYGLRFKRILEREKRYAKQDGRKKDLRIVSRKLGSIELVIEKLEKGAVKPEKAIKMIDKVVNSVEITIDAAVKSIIEDAVLAGTSQVDEESIDDDSEVEGDILDIFDTMELPKF